MKNLKYQEPEYYARFFDESEKIPFEVPPGCTKKYKIRKLVLVAPKLYAFQEINSVFLFFSISYSFFFVGDKIVAGAFKDEIKPSLIVRGRLTVDQDVATNHVREKGKQQCKLMN